MGWSFRKEAGDVLTKWENACIASTESQNMYNHKGIEYFWEASRKEHTDGAITGKVMLMIPGGNKCEPAGTFRIEGDGTIARAPKFLKDAAK